MATAKYCYGRDFLFCDRCGTQLLLSSPKHARCPHCNFKRSAKEILGKEIRYTITAEDIRRDLKIEPFVCLSTASMGVEQPEQKKHINIPCPDCGNPQLQYYSRQMRSADEGETVFYECPKCPYKSTENN